MVLTNGNLEDEWPTLPFYAPRRILETLLVRVKVLQVGRVVDNSIQHRWRSNGHSNT
jgi:hypothetical protein